MLYKSSMLPKRSRSAVVKSFRPPVISVASVVLTAHCAVSLSWIFPSAKENVNFYQQLFHEWCWERVVPDIFKNWFLDSGWRSL